MRERLLRKFQLTVSESKCYCLPKNLKECLLIVSVSYLEAHSSLNIQECCYRYKGVRRKREPGHSTLTVKEKKSRTYTVSVNRTLQFTNHFPVRFLLWSLLMPTTSRHLNKLKSKRLTYRSKRFKLLQKRSLVHLGLFHHAKSLFRTTFLKTHIWRENKRILMH